MPAVRGSIRRRLLVSLVGGAAVMAVLVFFVVQSVARQVARESQDNILAASALSVMENARAEAGSVTVNLPYAALSMLDSVTEERVFYAIRLGDAVLTGYADLPRPGMTSAAEGRGAGEVGQAVFRSDRFRGADVRIATVRRSFSTDLGRQVLEVTMAQTLSGQRAVLARMSRLSLAVGAGFFGLSALLAWVVAQSTIRPLDRLTASVARRGPGDLAPVRGPVPLEMAPLVAGLNDFMRRLQGALTRSEDFIAEAAHRVRTPLALVRAKADVLERRSARPETRLALREMVHALDEASRTAGQLLDHAMVAVRLDSVPRETVDLAALVRDAAARVRPLAEIKDVTIATETGPAGAMSDETGPDETGQDEAGPDEAGPDEAGPDEVGVIGVRGDAILLQNALYNLLDNALKYGPVGGSVTLSLRAEGSVVRVRVRDTGPGFPAGPDGCAPDGLTARFARGSNAAGVAGSGLGLTIVRDVIEAHGGSVALRSAKGGGACVELVLPRVA